MRKTRTQIAKFAAIAMLSVGAMALSASTVGAAVDLSATDLSSIDTAMANAIATAKASLGPKATPQDIAAAVTSAISTETQALITQYSQTSAMLVAEAAITGATNAGASPAEIGSGMGSAALAENTTTGIEIADAVGATAPSGAISAFTSTVTVSTGGIGQTLAAAATSYENVGAGGRGGNGNGGNGGNGNGGFGNGNGGGNGGGGGGGGCRNPSCT